MYGLESLVIEYWGVVSLENDWLHEGHLGWSSVGDSVPRYIKSDNAQFTSSYYG